MTAIAGGHPVTPDGRYFVVRGRLWRMANPELPPDERDRLVRELMNARRAVRDARKNSDEAAEASAHAARDVRRRRGGGWLADQQ